jgi:hypothetical protein
MESIASATRLSYRTDKVIRFAKPVPASCLDDYTAVRLLSCGKFPRYPCFKHLRIRPRIQLCQRSPTCDFAQIKPLMECKKIRSAMLVFGKEALARDGANPEVIRYADLVVLIVRF